MEERRPLVSIIVRTKDRPKLLKKALASISAQTYRPIEVVLVNDGGCELDREELKTLLGDVPLNYVRLEENKGRAHAGNVGIGNAKGAYVGFLDDDDEFYPEHVETLLSFLEQSEYKVAYTDSLMVYKSYDPQTYQIREERREIEFSKDYDYDELVFENYIPFMCLMFGKEVLKEAGGIDESLELYEDWDLLIRVGERHPFFHIKKTTALYNQWAGDMQIAQKNRDRVFLRNSYLAVLSRHVEKITKDRIHGFVAGHAHMRSRYQEDIKTLRSRVVSDDASIANLRKTVEGLGADLAASDARIKALESDLAALLSDIKGRDTKIGELKDSLGKKDEYISAVEGALREKEAYIHLIHSGHGWKLLSQYYALRDSILPEGTRRRLFAKLFLKTMAHPKEVLRNLRKSNLQKFFYYLRRSDPETLQKKIDQKLSDEFIEGGRGDTKESCLSATAGSSDYFSFVSELNSGASDEYVPLAFPRIPDPGIKLIAFYLPQFHPIPENDEWWGKGFTEWTNVTRAVPQFIGHYQPRLPGDLGFYDLRISDVQRRQVELARQYGVYGFCFHFYWFGGKTLLEGPVRRFAEDFDFPFCLNWANENWTRRWDGKENDVLISQKHSPEDDVAFIQYISAYLKNKNYIRVSGRPLLVVYRPSLLPNPAATAERWRRWCRENGIGEIYLTATHAFDHIDPASIGFDAAIEFPPNTFPLRDVSDQFRVVNPNYRGVVLDYREAMALSGQYSAPSYKKFRGVFPSWDNEARKPGRGTVLVNAFPHFFKKWLKDLFLFVDRNFESGEKLLFVNAWNEWAEGAYLEPDRRYGYAFLQAIADSFIEYAAEKGQKKIAYVCHDGHFHGAQLLSLHIVKRLALIFHYDVHFLLKSGGELEPEYAKYGTVYNLEREYRTAEQRGSLIRRLFDMGIREAICNTVTSGDLAELFRKKGIRSVTLVHELPNIIKENGLERNARLLAEYSDRVVFPAAFVREKFQAVAPVDDDKAVIQPQGLYKGNPYRGRKDEARKALRERLSLPEHARIVLGVGFADYRKGIDLFVEAAKSVSSARDDVYFLWVGNLHLEMEKKILEAARLCSQLVLQKAVADTSLFYAGADIYLLTSREDPFPAVVLEAMDVGLPVVGFDNAGGFKDIVTEDTGALVPYENVAALVAAVLQLFGDPQRMQVMERNTAKLVEERFGFNDYVYTLLTLLGHQYKKVSVIVPNYNYERYLALRMDSILKQTYPVYEIIVLDDASTDGSVEIARKYIQGREDMKLITNEINSGSVFRQWAKGLQAAKGDYIWIAEADDLCEGNFLEGLMACFAKDADVVMAYCQSKQIDDKGRVLADNYLEYTSDIDKDKWRSDYIREGTKEIADTLAVKNTVPNVSAVVFKKRDISSILDQLVKFRVAGDWFFYVWLLRQGKIGYQAQSLNLHRRHDRGVTKSEDKELHYREVADMQDYVMRDFDMAEETKEKILAYREYLTEYLELQQDLH
ncbi:MAG: glycoside hydrolase family 99-like domain-containing protein [Nitrospiraceae bacterium]|nr:glycoside hydrolase family 99-like domain-containing protein [Nitrospiraceae bacterium]